MKEQMAQLAEHARSFGLKPVFRHNGSFYVRNGSSRLSVIYDENGFETWDFGANDSLRNRSLDQVVDELKEFAG